MLYPILLIGGEIQDAAVGCLKLNYAAGDIGLSGYAQNIGRREAHVLIDGDYIFCRKGTCILGDGDAAVVAQAGLAFGLAYVGAEVSEVSGILHRFGIIHILPEAAVVGYEGPLFLVAHGIPVEFYQGIVIHQRIAFIVFLFQGCGEQLHELLLGPELGLNCFFQQLSYLFLGEDISDQLLQPLPVKVAVRILHTAEEVLRQLLRGLGLQSGGEHAVLSIQIVNKVALDTVAFFVTAACLLGRYIVQILCFDPDIPCPGYLHGQAFGDIHDERTIHLAYALVSGDGKCGLCIRGHPGGVRLVNEYHCIAAVGQQPSNHALGVQEYGAGAVVGGDALKADIPIGSVFHCASVVGIHFVDDYVLSGILVDFTAVSVQTVGAYAAAGIQVQGAFCEVHIAGGDIPGLGIHGHVAALSAAHVSGVYASAGIQVHSAVFGTDITGKFNVLAGIQVRRSIVNDSHVSAEDAASRIHIQNDAVHNDVRVESDILGRTDIGICTQYFLAFQVPEDELAGAGGYLQRIAGSANAAGAVAVNYHVTVIGADIHVILSVNIRVELLQERISVTDSPLQVLHVDDYLLALAHGLHIADVVEKFIAGIRFKGLAELGVGIGGEDAAVRTGDQVKLVKLIVDLVPVPADGEVVDAAIRYGLYQLVFSLLNYQAVLIGAVILDSAGRSRSGFHPGRSAGVVIILSGEVLGNDIGEPLQVDALILQECDLGTCGIIPGQNGIENLQSLFRAALSNRAILIHVGKVIVVEGVFHAAVHYLAFIVVVQLSLLAQVAQNGGHDAGGGIGLTVKLGGEVILDVEHQAAAGEIHGIAYHVSLGDFLSAVRHLVFGDVYLSDVNVIQRPYYQKHGLAAVEHAAAAVGAKVICIIVGPLGPAGTQDQLAGQDVAVGLIVGQLHIIKVYIVIALVFEISVLANIFQQSPAGGLTIGYLLLLCSRQACVAVLDRFVVLAGVVELIDTVAINHGHSVYGSESDTAESIELIHLIIHGGSIQEIDVYLLVVYQIVLPLFLAAALIVLEYLELLLGCGLIGRVRGIGSNSRFNRYLSVLVRDGVLPCHSPFIVLGAGKGIGIVSLFDLVLVLTIHQSDSKVDGSIIHLYCEALRVKGDVSSHRLHLGNSAHAGRDYLIAAGSIIYHIEVVLWMAVYQIARLTIVIKVGFGFQVRPEFLAVKAQGLTAGIQELVPNLGFHFLFQLQLIAELSGLFIVIGVEAAVRAYIYGGPVLKLIGGAGLMVLCGQSGGGGLHLHVAYAQVVAVHVIPFQLVHLGLRTVIVLPVVVELREVEAVLPGVFYTGVICANPYAFVGLDLREHGGAHVRRPDNVLYPVHKVLVLGIHLNLRVDNVAQAGDGLYCKRGIAYPQLFIVIGISLPGNILSGTQEVFNGEYLVGIYLQVIQILCRAGFVPIPGSRVELSLVVGIAVI